MKTTPILPAPSADLIARLTAHVIAECNAVDAEARYVALLDEAGDVTVAGLTFSPSQIVRECDPVAFRCGVADMTGTDDSLREIGGEYYDERDVEKARESFVDDLDSQERDAQRELDEMEAQEGGEDSDADSISALRAKVAQLAADGAHASRHSF